MLLTDEPSVRPHLNLYPTSGSWMMNLGDHWSPLSSAAFDFVDSPWPIEDKQLSLVKTARVHTPMRKAPEQSKGPRWKLRLDFRDQGVCWTEGNSL